jgi:hypothetical protein
VFVPAVKQIVQIPLVVLITTVFPAGTRLLRRIAKVSVLGNALFATESGRKRSLLTNALTMIYGSKTITATIVLIVYTPVVAHGWVRNIRII